VNSAGNPSGEKISYKVKRDSVSDNFNREIQEIQDFGTVILNTLYVPVNF
jgi:hypothetical protein